MKMNDFTEEMAVVIPKDTTRPSHPTLRQARLDDIPVLMNMAQKLGVGPLEMLEPDPEETRIALETFIASDQKDVLMLVSHIDDRPVGCIAAYAFSPLFTKNKIAVEVFWYLEEEHRKGRRGLDMMKAFEYWAKLVGCKAVQYGWLVTSPESMKTLYEKTGAVFAEETYYKKV